MHNTPLNSFCSMAYIEQLATAILDSNLAWLKSGNNSYMVCTKIQCMT